MAYRQTKYKQNAQHFIISADNNVLCIQSEFACVIQRTDMQHVNVMTYLGGSNMT
jgi:hypothetical protein